MYLLKDKLQHISTVAHEGKVVVLATDAEGKIFYTVKQDGFEDSYLNTPADQRTGWENWKTLEFANEADDQSVIEKEKAELTHQKNPSQYLLKSLYKTENITAVAPVQVISALGHIYVFRQSKSNTLLVDRFVLDGMTNKLNRKLEVRFKRSKQKHEPTKNMQRGSSGLVNIDTLDFRDANGNFFYEPTTELCLINNLHKGWFSVVLVPTVENDVYRWHIFAYNSQTQKVELTTIRASEEGLFDVQDYTVFEESNDSLVPRKIPGVIKRTLDINGVTVTNGLSATKYDLQQAQQTQSGEEQLLKTATRLMLAIPTDKGAAAFSFAIAGDGTLAEIDETPDSKIIRSRQREVLLPLNTLDEIKAIGDKTPPPQGLISGFAAGTDEEDIEDLVKISTDRGASDLANYDLVKIRGTSDYQGLYQTIKVDKNTFDINIPLDRGLGYWEKEDKEEGGLIFDGMITAYQKTADGKLRVTCANHGLENGDQVQITGTEDYNDTYPVRKIDDTHFVIERKWAMGEAVNVKLVSQKRRGIVFDGKDDYVEIPYTQSLNPNQFTVSFWAKVTGGQGVCSPLCLRDSNALTGYFVSAYPNGTWRFFVGSSSNWGVINGPGVVLDTWTHITATYDGDTLKLYVDGVLFDTLKTAYTPNLQAPLVIGALSGTGSAVQNLFPGQIAEVRIWKTARTAEEIKNSMYLQLTGKEVGLAGYWRLGGISEGKVVDFSVNGNDGTVYGEPYVSAATLNRKLAGGAAAVKYSNSELFAVSERATYTESFEFKVNSASPVNLAYLDNADGKNIGTKIFTFSYWGKPSRSAEEKKTISAVQNKFEDLGNGWYRASCNVTIPDEVSLLRSFEIANVKGDWQSLEIRKHRIRLLSDSITEAKYTDSVTLATLADDHAISAARLKALELKEKQEIVLLKEKQELEAKIAAYNAQDGTRAEIQKLESKIAALTSEEQPLKSAYQKEVDNPFNYFCQIKSGPGVSNYYGENFYIVADKNGPYIVGHRPSTPDKWQFVHHGGDVYSIKSAPGVSNIFGADFYILAMPSESKGVPPTTLVGYPADSMNRWQFVHHGGDIYSIKSSGSIWRWDGYISGLADQGFICISPTPTGPKWQLIKCEPSNSNIERAKQNWEVKAEALKLAKNDLQRLQKILTATPADKAAWDARLAQVIALITALQTELNTLNTDFLNAVKNTQVLNNLDATIAQKDALSLEIIKLRQEKNDQQITYDKEKSNPANYAWYLENKGSGLAITHYVDALLKFPDSSSHFVDKLVFLPRANRGDFQWTFVDQGDGWFRIEIVANNEGLQPGSTKSSCIYMCRNAENQKGEHWANLVDDCLLQQLNPDRHKFKLLDAGDGYYYIQIKETGRILSQGGGSVYKDEVKLPQVRLNNDYEKFRLIKVEENSLNGKVENLLKSLNALQAALKLKEQELANLIEIINESTQSTPQTIPQVAKDSKTMPQVAKDSKGLVTQGALLGFVQTASRLNAIETCEGNVQLSYFDNQGRMRQTNYDATADGKNAAFEQWIPDAQRACLNFSNSNSVVKLNQALYLPDDWSIEAWFVYPLPETAEWNTLIRGKDANPDHHILVRNRKQLGIYLNNDSLGQKFYDSGFNMESLTEGWHHLVAVGREDTTLFYIDGKKVGDVKAKALKDAEDNLKNKPNDAAAKQKVEDIKKASLKSKSDVYAIGNSQGSGQPFGKVAEVRIWKVALSDDEIAINSTLLLSGNEPGLLAYYPMSEATGVEVRDHSGNGNNATVSGANWWGCTAAIGKIDNLPSADALVCAEYSTVTLESSTKTKVAIMRRFFASPATNGVTLLPDKRIEALELKWIGNAQFAPTLLGYIEGPPPVPSENLTLSDDYNGATSVELTMSEDVAFSWNRSQDAGLGANAEVFIGGDTEMNAGLGLTTKIGAMRAGFKGNFDFSYQFQNESNITSSSSLSMTDKLELRGTPEETIKFPHLGTRFIPKNIGYALVVSALADVFVTRLARSGKMVGYQVQPVDGIPPDVNTITFLMNPAYTMNGSLDGMTGSSATSDRFFKHVPEMRSQYGSLYPASYYRLKEAYDLKRQIEAEDKRRESYFSNFDVRLVDETSLNRNIDSGDAPTTIGVQREEDKPGTQMTDEEKKKAEEEKLKNAKADAKATVNEKSAATKAKQAEIQSKINDQEKRVQATDSFAGWQKRMESIQIRSGKRNIVNTYVWDADGGLRTEAQSFANTVEHTIGGSFGMNAGLGFEGKFAAGAAVELTAQATVNLTQTMSKTEARSKGFKLNVDLSGLEYKGITDYNDRPILPGEKVDRYRFMSFYLEGSTNNFHDFFSYVVDPEWLRSNDEEAVALRQAQAGKPNKAWRVLHRVTYVERPALMGFGRDLRKLRAAAAVSDNQALLDKIAKLEEENQKLEEKLNTIINLLKGQK